MSREHKLDCGEPPGEVADQVVPDGTTGLFGRSLMFAVVMSIPLVATTALSPILTRVLGPAEFGLVATAMSVNYLLISMVCSGLDQAVLVQRAEDGDSHLSRGLVTVAIAAAALVTTAVFLVSRWWAGWFGFGGAEDLVVAILVWSGLNAVLGVMSNLLMSENRLGAYTGLVMVWLVGSQVGGLLLVLLYRPNALVYLVGSAVAVAVAFVIGLPTTRPRLGGLRDRPTMVRALRLGVPMAANNVAVYVLAAGDRILVNRELGNVEVGRYQVAYTIGYVVVMMLGYLSQSWVVKLAQVRDPAARMVLHEQSRNALFRILIPVVLGISLASPVALRLFVDQRYQPETLSIVVVVIAVSAFPVAAATAVSRELLTLRRGRTLAFSTGLAAVLNIGLNLVLLPVWGIVGAAAATLISFVVQAVANYAMLPRQPRWPSTPPWLWVAVGASGLVAVGSTFVPDTTVGMGARFAAGLACLPWLAVEFRRARTLPSLDLAGADLVPGASADPSRAQNHQLSRGRDTTVGEVSQWSGRHPSCAQAPDGRAAEPVVSVDARPLRFQSDRQTPTVGPRARHHRPDGRGERSWADRVVLVYRAELACLALWVTSRLFFDLGLLACLAVLSAVGVLVVTVWSMVATLGLRAGPPSSFKLTVVTSQVMTAVVSAVLLAAPSPDERIWAQAACIALPAGLLVDFVFFDPHRRLRARACWWALAVPVVYFGALGVTGAVAEVPYEIFRVGALGWPLVGAHVAVCLAVAASACAATLAADGLLPARPLVGSQRQP